MRKQEYIPNENQYKTSVKILNEIEISNLSDDDHNDDCQS